MSRTRLSLALSLALLASPLAVMAQDAGATADPAQNTEAADAPAADEPTPDLTWTLALTSDYVFRGISQTNFDPAIQGGLNYAFGDSGFYVGAWASNVDFNVTEGPNVELDTFVGWGHDLNDKWNIDLSVVHYAYLGDDEDIVGDSDYNEFFVKTTYAEMLTFTVAYANDYGNLGYHSMYYNLAGTWDVGHDFNINASVGHSQFSDDNGSYNDWNLGVSRQFGPVNAGINYYDTNAEGGRTSDALVLTLGFGNG